MPKRSGIIDLMNSNQFHQLTGSLFEKSKQVIEFIRGNLENRWIRAAVQLTILTFSIIYLIRSYQSVDLSNLRITLDASQIAWSFIITLGAIFLGGLGWWLTLISVNYKISLLDAIRIHLISNLAKYIPGYAWQLLSKGYLTKRTGASTMVTGVSMTLELLQIFITGTGLIILFFPVELFHTNPIYIRFEGYLTYIKIGLFLTACLLPVLLPKIVRSINPIATKIRINTYPLVLSSLSILSGWLLFGIAFWLLGNAVQPISVVDIPIFIFTLAASFLIGLLIIVIPASIGVRESLMVFFLANILPAPIAVIIASLSRLILTICELVSAGGVRLFNKMSKNTG